MSTVVFYPQRKKRTVVIIGVDLHKDSHTATAIVPGTNTPVVSLRVEASLAGYRQLLCWAKSFPERQWAIENARGLGQHLAQWLIARGETVVDVRTTATARVRELSRGGRRKNDVLDASAAASVAAAQGDVSPVRADDETTVFALLEERRANLVANRVRLVNQLHALLRDMIPGGAKPALTAEAATALLRGFRAVSAAERTRKELARELVREIRMVDARLLQIAGRMTEALRTSGTRLLEVQGVGPVLAVRLLGRTGRPSRFASSAAFASYAGVAPIEVASGQRSRHRLSRSGDRQLNSALHLVAVTQVRMRCSVGRGYYDRKIAEGKTHNEALRCLKQRLADHVWRLMLSDERLNQAVVDNPAVVA